MPKIINAGRNLYNKVNNHKKNLHEYDVELQHKSCNQYKEILNILTCNKCFDPYANEEEYLFKEFRAFCVNKKGLNLVIISLTQLSRDPPPSRSRHHFQCSTCCISSFKSTKSSLTKDFEEYRHVCDVCLTSIFNLHYVCSGCAIDVCLHYYNNWRQYASEDMETMMIELNEEDTVMEESDAEAVLNEKLEMKSIDSVVLTVTPGPGDQHFDYIEDRGSSSNALLQERSSSLCYESEENLKEYCESLGASRVIKIRVTHYFNRLTSKGVFKEVLNNLHDNYMNKVLPAPDYCSEGGFFIISNRLPEEYMPPYLGSKMFISQVNDSAIKICTKLHFDMADAVNVMCYAKSESATTVWNIFASKDPLHLRAFVHKLRKQRKWHFVFNSILRKSSYLEEMDIIELEKQTGVKPSRFKQKTGGAVFIPAGCAHQVQNVVSSIKCTYDFLSPETMSESNMITNHFQDIKIEDKLQLKLTLLYA
ncbi:hypothetical protein K501DRAFT_274454 [Backusella circina FSU 941]|nr:hypothetical protein K501DRAFT_274454 [Backusella circina FSU 941]